MLGEHAGRLHAHIARIVGPSEADDVFQEVCVSAWRSIRSFEGSSVRAWLYRIATNRAIDAIRARRRRGELPLEADDDEDRPTPEPSDGGPGPLERASERELLTVIEEALAGLPAEQRAAVILRDLEGFDYEEIGRITAAEPGTVRSRIHRGRMGLRRALVARGWRGTGG